MTITNLYISPGHNFVGHHGLPPGEHPLHEVDMIECVAGRGIRGDRYFDYKPDYKGQITFFSSEVFADICKRLDIVGKTPAAARRNVVTEGIDLNSLVGNRFAVQGVEFEGISECKPCYWMDSAIGTGAEEALQGRGGLRAKILSDGFLRLGS